MASAVKKGRKTGSHDRERNWGLRWKSVEGML
jgi:hypothetical protein